LANKEKTDLRIVITLRLSYSKLRISAAETAGPDGVEACRGIPQVSKQYIVIPSGLRLNRTDDATGKITHIHPILSISSSSASSFLPHHLLAPLLLVLLLAAPLRPPPSASPDVQDAQPPRRAQAHEGGDFASSASERG
jgi:hypothetical protein